MPTRILREGIIESESVNKLSPGAELLYRRLMSKVDDYGRFHNNPALILAACYPLQLDRISVTDVAGWLKEFNDWLVTFYSVNGRKYLQLNRLGQRTRGKSKYPEPGDGDAQTHIRKRSRTTDGGSRTTDGGSRTTDGGSRTTDGGSRTTAVARAFGDGDGDGDGRTFGSTETAATPRRETETETAAAALSHGSNGHKFAWPLAAAAVQDRFPRTESAFVSQLADLAKTTLSSVGTDPSRLTDQVLADAIHTATSPTQRSAKLYETTLPVVIQNWAKPKKGKSNARPIPPN
jgi:hypothetical protein